MSESKTPTPEPLSTTRRDSIRQRAESAVNRTDVELLERVCMEDVPALLEQLDEMDRLRTELAAVIGENNRLALAATQVEAERNTLRTEQAAVFAALRDALGTSPATLGQAAAQGVKAIDQVKRIRAVRAEWAKAAGRARVQRDRAEERRDVTGVVRENAWATAYHALGTEIGAALNGTEASR